MPVYKLCSFGTRTFDEMCRLVLEETSASYEDVRYTPEIWPEHKQEMLFGQMPVLFVDGEQIAHSRAAVRYLAREFKLDGGSSLNAAKTDMWIEVFVEAMMKFPFSETDEQKKNVSVADIVAYALMDALRQRETSEFLDDVPKFKSMMSALEERPRIAKRIAERPEIKK